MMRPKTISRIAVAAVALSLAACHKIDGVQLVQLTDPPLPGRVTEDRIELTEGTAMGVRIVVLEDESSMIDPYDLEWEVHGDAAVFRPLWDSPGYYVVGGAKAGEARIIAKEGTSEIAIPVVVSAQ